MQEDRHDGDGLSEDRSYAMVVAQNAEPVVFQASRKKSLASPTTGDKDKRFKEGTWPDVCMEQEEISRLCKTTHHLKDQGLVILVSLNYTEILERVTFLKKSGLLLYFMGRVLSESQLHTWARAIGGANSFSHFIFLGKGIYLGICQDSRLYFELISLGGAWGSGLFALAMPWDPSFDPLQEFLHYCPVWVTLQNVSVLFLPYIDQLVGGLGRVLFVPKLKAFVPSRNIRVCILWNLDQPIPAMLDIPLGEKDHYYLKVSFSSFPHACYKCRKIGHFAKSCPESVQFLHKSNKDKDNPSFNSSVKNAFSLTESKSVTCAPGCQASIVNEMVSQNPFNVLDTEESSGHDVMVDEDGMAATTIVENLPSDVLNIGSAAQPVSKQREDTSCGSMVDEPRVINLEDGCHSLYVDLKAEVDAQPRQQQLESDLTTQLLQNTSTHEERTLGNISQVASKKGQENLNCMEEEGIALQPVNENEQVNQRFIVPQDMETMFRENDSVRPGYGGGGISRMKNEVSIIVPGAQELRIVDKENIMDDWVYEPPEMPHSFGYFDFKTEKYKIKGRLEDTPYGKKIYFWNKKVRGLKSFLQEFRLQLEDLVFLDG